MAIKPRKFYLLEKTKMDIPNGKCQTIEHRALVLGPFPEPTHGFSVATDAIASIFEASGFNVVRCDLAPGRGDSLVGRSLDFVRRLGRAAGEIFRPGRKICYFGFSGGGRQIIDIVLIAAARMTRAPVFLHHHSFAYINRRSRLTNVALKLAGKDAVHVVLGRGMGDRLSATYPSVCHVLVVSNFALVVREVAGSPRPVREPPTLAYFSNITLEKGFDTYLKILEEIHQHSVPFQALVAGPFADPMCKIRFEAALEKGLPIKYIGPVYGNAKKAFLADIDLLIFPTRYVNEAEPIVLIEAISSGIPIIASDRGCIADILRFGGGLLVSETKWTDTSEWIAQQISDGTYIGNLNNNAYLSALRLNKESKAQIANLISIISNIFH